MSFTALGFKNDKNFINRLAIGLKDAQRNPKQSEERKGIYLIDSI